jgi:hypothetical protein
MCWFNHLSTPLGRLLVGPVEPVHAVTICQALRKSAHVGLEGGGAPTHAEPAEDRWFRTEKLFGCRFAWGVDIADDAMAYAERRCEK